MEYCSYFWAETLKYKLAPFDRMQRWVTQVVDDFTFGNLLSTKVTQNFELNIQYRISIQTF